jgi:SCP-2 sterol transfer family
VPARHTVKEDQMRFGIAAAVDKALARRAGPRMLPAQYQIDEDAEAAGAGRPAQLPARRHPLRHLAGQVGPSTRQSLRGRGQAGLQRVVGRMTDARLEQIFAGTQAQRAVFGMMTRHFQPGKAAGFDGAIVWDLGMSDGTRRPWAIEIHDDEAQAHQGASPDAALTITVPLADFVRVLTTAGSFYPLIVDGRMTMEGDLGLASKMAEMFGGRSAY